MAAWEGLAPRVKGIMSCSARGAGATLISAAGSAAAFVFAFSPRPGSFSSHTRSEFRVSLCGQVLCKGPAPQRTNTDTSLVTWNHTAQPREAPGRATTGLPGPATKEPASASRTTGGGRPQERPADLPGAGRPSTGESEGLSKPLGGPERLEAPQTNARRLYPERTGVCTVL